MRRLLVIAVIIGAGGFAAASQAGMSVRDDARGIDTKSDRISMRSDAQTCRIEKTLKYDFNGNPYMKKVRICA